jgi:hypothetical protein
VRASYLRLQSIVRNCAGFLIEIGAESLIGTKIGIWS